MRVLAAINVEATIVFAVIVSITLGITYWASKRARSAVGFYAAGRQRRCQHHAQHDPQDDVQRSSFLAAEHTGLPAERAPFVALQTPLVEPLDRLSDS